AGAGAPARPDLPHRRRELLPPPADGGVSGAGGGRGARVMGELVATIAARKRDLPEGSYTTRLLREGVDRIGRKIGEEAAEVIIAAKNGAAEELAWEVADLWYHTLVLLAAVDVEPELVWRQLRDRRGAMPRAGREGTGGEPQR